MEFNLANESADPDIEGQKYACITYVPHPEQNTIFFKIRGVYETFEEANQRAMHLTGIDPLFPIYIGEVGKFLPAQSHMINLAHLNNIPDNGPTTNVPFNIIDEHTSTHNEVETNDQIEDQELDVTNNAAEGIEEDNKDVTNNDSDENIKSTNSNIPDEPACLACQEKTRNSLLLPCRHLVYCLECSHQHVKRDPKCPVCRKNISEIINIFIP